MAENSTPKLKATTVTIELMGRPLQIRCPEHEIAGLQKAAEYLDNTMRIVSESKPLSPEKIAVLSALTLASQILKLESQTNQHMDSLNQRLGNLQDKLEYALDSEENFLISERQSAQA